MKLWQWARPLQNLESNRRILYAKLMEMRGLHRTLVEVGLELDADAAMVEIERITARLLANQLEIERPKDD